MIYLRSKLSPPERSIRFLEWRLFYWNKPSKIVNGKERPMDQRLPPKGTSTWQPGHREIGGRKIYFRSKWEINYCRYLQWLKERGQIKEWEYEVDTFWFEKIKRGVRSYKPDFKVTENNGSVAYHEVKGWLDPRSRTKLKRMFLYHPAVKIVLIEKKFFSQNGKKLSGLVHNWE